VAIRILCADDEPANLILLDAILSSRGYEILKARDGKEALDIIKTEQIDIALLDVMMPEINGHDVCRAIKSDGKYRPVPVIMLTGLSAEQESEECRDAGADAFVTKPLHYPEVIAMIGKLLRNSV
jgi:CheY-like chemotaxis protein